MTILKLSAAQTLALQSYLAREEGLPPALQEVLAALPSSRAGPQPVPPSSWPLRQVLCPSCGPSLKGKARQDLSLTLPTPKYCEVSIEARMEGSNSNTSLTRLPSSQPASPPPSLPSQPPSETPDQSPSQTPFGTPHGMPRESPLETPLETPHGTPHGTPRESPLETHFETPHGAPCESRLETPLERRLE
ncbi:hypothetical protein F5877DRAFT_85958 [Lentinula edodes]|nr:hypothetical protein F5877DRAFT_85958 [Lentinula edodes]